MRPLENLKGFAASRPPLMVFMVSLSAFAIILLSLAYVIKTNEIKNPDLSEDWNVFLESFSELQFCITGNLSELPPTSLPLLDHKDVDVLVKGAKEEPISMDESDTHNTTAEPWLEATRNHSVSLLVTIRPTLDFLKIPHNVTHLSGTVMGHQLGLRGAASQEEMNVTFALPYEWNNTKCDEDGNCNLVRIYTCVTFQAVPSVFPVTRRPQSCQTPNETGVEYHGHIEGHKDYAFLKYYRCRQQTKISVHYELNPTLTVMLSVHDRSLINLHLMHTSYFLFVMVITMFCYAIIRGRPAKVKYHHVNAYDQQQEDAT